MSDLSSLTFVDPDEQDARYRVVLWAAPGEGKSVGAASAPDPILVLSADRPGAYRYARRHHGGKDIREVRYENRQTLAHVHAYLKGDGQGVRTVVLDPFGGIYDRLVEEIGGREPKPEHYQQVNKALLKFLYAMRDFDINLVLVAHERLNDGKGGDGKLYPNLGGPALINRVLAESDIVAHVEREPGGQGEAPRYMAQLTPVRNLVCKESTGLLGDRRPLDLSEWFTAAMPDDTDLPWAAPLGDDGDDEQAVGDVETINGEPVDGPPTPGQEVML